MKALYFDTITMIERLHKLYHDVVAAELERLRIYDISSTQVFMLYNLGKSEMTAGELSNRGYYLGSNVSYNLKKLVENGYFDQTAAAHDKRATKVKLTDKGLKLYVKIDAIFDQQAKNLKHNNVQDKTLTDALKLMRKLDSYWNFIATHQY